MDKKAKAIIEGKSMTVKRIASGDVSIGADGVTFNGDPMEFHSGGWVTTTGTDSTGTSWTLPSTTTIPITMAPPAPKPEMKMPKQLPAPTKSPRKIVLAFLGEDDEVEWMGMVYPDQVDVTHNLREPSEMLIGFKLIDANEPK